MFVKETKHQRLRDEHLCQVLEAYPIAAGIRTRQTERAASMYSQVTGLPRTEGPLA